jgi:hypothetical protein
LGRIESITEKSTRVSSDREAGERNGVHYGIKRARRITAIDHGGRLRAHFQRTEGIVASEANGQLRLGNDWWIVGTWGVTGEIYNVMALYEAVDVEGIPTINDEEGLELRYFPLNKPIPELNPFTELVLRKAGLVEW